MKLLLDQDIYFVTERFLRSLKHDIITAKELELSQAKDEELLQVARVQERILVTRDRDFGNLVFVKAVGTGVIYLRIQFSTQDLVHTELQRILNSYTEDELRTAFVVVGSKGHRYRHVPENY